MTHARLVALALSFLVLLAAAPAEARKRCRTVPSEAAATAPAEATARWPHDASSDWVHEGASGDWVHRNVRYEANESSGWVHETDYGWWAALPDAGISELDEEDELEEGLGEDCTVSRDRNECVALGNQLAHYRFRLELALEREDALWESSLRQTIERLEERGARFDCPWVEPSLKEKIDQTVEAVAKAVGVAAQVAAMLYRMGLF